MNLRHFTNEKNCQPGSTVIKRIKKYKAKSFKHKSKKFIIQRKYLRKKTFVFCAIKLLVQSIKRKLNLTATTAATLSAIYL
jgi:hypothetical protein